MLCSTLLAAAALAIGIQAQGTGTASSSPSTTTSTPVTTHIISVGVAGFKFSPDNITADVGDIVEFRFYPTGHSVARAEFKFPCIPYEYVEVNRKGFFSGFEPVQAILNDPPRFQVKINDSEPIFFYCSAPGACTHDKMIGVINPNATWTLDAQKSFLANTSVQLSPGDPFPTEGPPPGMTPRPTVLQTSSSTAAAPTSSSTAVAPAAAGSSSSSSGGNSLGAGAIAGISIGAAAVVVLSAALVYICGWRMGRGGGKGTDQNGGSSRWNGHGGWGGGGGSGAGGGGGGGAMSNGGGAQTTRYMGVGGAAAMAGGAAGGGLAAEKGAEGGWGSSANTTHYSLASSTDPSLAAAYRSSPERHSPPNGGGGAGLGVVGMGGGAPGVGGAGPQQTAPGGYTAIPRNATPPRSPGFSSVGSVHMSSPQMGSIDGNTMSSQQQQQVLYNLDAIAAPQPMHHGGMAPIHPLLAAQHQQQLQQLQQQQQHSRAPSPHRQQPVVAELSSEPPSYGNPVSRQMSWPENAENNYRPSESSKMYG